MILTKEIDSIVTQIVKKFNPLDIFIFGSYAKGLIDKRSDIDLCIIINTNNKRKLVEQILLEIDYDSDLDVIVYTEEEWDKYKEDPSTFANIIFRTGGSIIGRYKEV
jgi:predicted nucleotidyltransferase